jgi:RNA polymerase-binding transcription factor DksA
MDVSGTLSPDDLDRLRGLLLAERDSALARLAEHEALLFSAPPDAFGDELRRFARVFTALTRAAIDDVDETLERLVESHGSCEWCGTAIPPDQRKVIPPGRLCTACQQRSR